MWVGVFILREGNNRLCGFHIPGNQEERAIDNDLDYLRCNPERD